MLQQGAIEAQFKMASLILCLIRWILLVSAAFPPCIHSRQIGGSDKEELRRSAVGLLTNEGADTGLAEHKRQVSLRQSLACLMFEK